jgi:uncharacterized protein YcbK (DUF882 family)
MSQILLGMLDGARELAGVPFVIMSAFRCKTHNKNVGGRAESAHIYGYAVDIAAVDNHSRFRIVYGLINAGFTRIIVYKDKKFIHTDIDGTKPNEILCIY